MKDFYFGALLVIIVSLLLAFLGTLPYKTKLGKCLTSFSLLLAELLLTGVLCVSLVYSYGFALVILIILVFIVVMELKLKKRI